MDANFAEDEDSTIDKNAFNNLSIMRKLVLSVCKLVQPTKKHPVGLKSIRKIFGWDLKEQLKLMLGIFDADTLREAMLNSVDCVNSV